ncbi:DnaB-like helicase C-terminal domain-containing protein [Dermacoccus nishinomiyaensis]|uniref:DnaB-like helicase C-terminal domain-containing protein n=1 Tax=Dermacoccus nishinomiyaensis TaxID=1274 RepID=UPI00248E4AEA|nr:DnaB-like helicase C-terminal domain-containing protein [Dermacoccus nishinomiyaensis]
MSRAEDVLYLSLTDVDRLEQLALIGLPEEAIPTSMMRPVVAWAIEEFHRSGRKTAPSREALIETWGEVIDDARVELLPEDEDADTTGWAIDKLKSQFVFASYERFVRESVTAMSEATELERLPLLGQLVDELHAVHAGIQSRQHHLSIQEGMTEALAKYEQRSQPGQSNRGMLFGVEKVDEHTNGIQPGEVCVLAAGPKTGKSWFINYSSLSEYKRGKRVCVFTLENSVEMVYDRIACMNSGISYRRWQRGLCLPEEVERVRAFVEEVRQGVGKGSLDVIMPDADDRTMQSMVRKAQTLGCQSLFIDQLTFVTYPDAQRLRLARHQEVGKIMHDLKELVSTGSETMPVMVAHQINREGVKAAKKVGYLSMENLAEGSEVERTADWVFGLFQSSVQREAAEATLQILASRREDSNAWSMNWEPSMGLVDAYAEAVLEL